jgi:hypothetical protein
VKQPDKKTTQITRFLRTSNFKGFWSSARHLGLHLCNTTSTVTAIEELTHKIQVTFLLTKLGALCYERKHSNLMLAHRQPQRFLHGYTLVEERPHKVLFCCREGLAYRLQVEKRIGHLELEKFQLKLLSQLCYTYLLSEWSSSFQSMTWHLLCYHICICFQNNSARSFSEIK